MDVYRMLEPLQVGDMTPEALWIHGTYQWAVVERREQSAILILILEDRECPQHMFLGWPTCWIATNANKSVLSAIHVRAEGTNKACDLVHQQKRRVLA
jgi:hypothetical protein